MSTPPPVPPSPPYHAPNAAVPPSGGRVPNHMAWAIVSTIFAFCLCCFVGAIPGIVAIVFASKVNSAVDRGDFAAAQAASANAKLWSWITTGLAILGLLINIAFVATGGMAQYQEYMEQARALQSMQQ